MKTYVLGFAFSSDLNSLVLIHKNKPDWQKGKLNGIGGSVEAHEPAKAAMQREFAEEAGVMMPVWDHFGQLFVTDGSAEVELFATTMDLSQVRRGVIDEGIITVVTFDNLMAYSHHLPQNVMLNLVTLVCAAKKRLAGHLPGFFILGEAPLTK